jgi:hypothetical protein
MDQMQWVWSLGVRPLRKHLPTCSPPYIKLKPLTLRGEGLTFAVPPLLANLSLERLRYLLPSIAPMNRGDTLGYDNGTLSDKAYSPNGQGFSLQLPSPFNLCASIGSHLPRLSELRWRYTSLVLSLYHFQLLIVKPVWQLMRPLSSTPGSPDGMLTVYICC